MDVSMLQRMSRRELQALAKSHGVPANLKSDAIVEAITTSMSRDRSQPHLKAVTSDLDPTDDQDNDEDFFSLPTPPSASDIRLVPFKAAQQMIESPTLIVKLATTPLRPFSPDRMRKETETRTPLASGRSMSMALRIPVNQPQPQPQRTQTPNRASHPRPHSSHTRAAERPKTPVSNRPSDTPVRTAFGGRIESTTPRTSQLQAMRQSQHRPITPNPQGPPQGTPRVTPRSSFGGGAVRPTTPGRNQTPGRKSVADSFGGGGAVRPTTPAAGRNQTPGRTSKGMVGTFPLSPRPSANPTFHNSSLNQAKGQIHGSMDVMFLAEPLLIRDTSDLPLPVGLRLQLRHAVVPSNGQSSIRLALMHCSEPGVSSKEVATGIASSIAGELSKKQGPGGASLQKPQLQALYLDLRKSLGENGPKASPNLRCLLKDLGALPPAHSSAAANSNRSSPAASGTILILDGIEALREFQRLDMDSAMNASEASDASYLKAFNLKALGPNLYPCCLLDLLAARARVKGLAQLTQPPRRSSLQLMIGTLLPGCLVLLSF